MHVLQTPPQNDEANDKNNNKEIGDREIEIIPMYLSVICCSPSSESSPNLRQRPPPHMLNDARLYRL